MAAKVRPVLVLSAPYGDKDYALLCVVPHTTTPRSSQFESPSSAPFLEAGAFNVQGLLAVPAAKFLRKLGVLEAAELHKVESSVRRWLVLP